jgi:hypothetical protein
MALKLPNFTESDFKIEPDGDGNIHIPDELIPLFHKLGMQLRFHTISGENEIQVIARMVKLAYFFFNPETKTPTNG